MPAPGVQYGVTVWLCEICCLLVCKHQKCHYRATNCSQHTICQAKNVNGTVIQSVSLQCVIVRIVMRQPTVELNCLWALTVAFVWIKGWMKPGNTRQQMMSFFFLRATSWFIQRIWTTAIIGHWRECCWLHFYTWISQSNVDLNAVVTALAGVRREGRLW